MNRSAATRLCTFMRGEHPQTPGISLGPRWIPPVAVADAVIRRVHREAPEAGAEDGGDPSTGCAGGPALFRASWLKAMGLDEASLAEVESLHVAVLAAARAPAN